MMCLQRLVVLLAAGALCEKTDKLVWSQSRGPPTQPCTVFTYCRMDFLLTLCFTFSFKQYNWRFYNIIEDKLSEKYVERSLIGQICSDKS